MLRRQQGRHAAPRHHRRTCAVSAKAVRFAPSPASEITLLAQNLLNGKSGSHRALMLRRQQGRHAAPRHNGRICAVSAKAVRFAPSPASEITLLAQNLLNGKSGSYGALMLRRQQGRHAAPRHHRRTCAVSAKAVRLAPPNGLKELVFLRAGGLQLPRAQKKR